MGKGYLRLPPGFDPIDELLAWNEITYIGYESYIAKTEAVVLDMNLNANGFNVMKQEFPELSGSSQHISVQELRFSDEDIDLLGRTIYPEESDPRTDDHATQMATIIGGAGNSLISGLGVLPEVTLVSSGFDEPTPDQNSYYEDFDIQVQNHSYGTAIESFYGAFAQLFDISANENPDLLHVFSSGNSGQGVAEDGVYADLSGYANLTGNYKMSKNALVVGAVDTVGRTNVFVSNGPAYDGRVKPEVVAYSIFGSSNSAAMTSGLAGALQEKYQNDHGVPASSSLIKSAIITAADDAGSPGLDHRTGYGSIDAAGSMRIISKAQFLEDQLEVGAEDRFEINVPEGAVNLKVTLVWNDLAAEAGVDRALVNDLDLRVAQEDGAVTLPWVLNTGASMEALSAPAIRGEDHLNNVEQVTISDPQGPITIHVSGNSLVGEQSYALTYEWELVDTFEWRYPRVNDFMPFNGESDGYFRWNSTYSTNAGELSVSYDRGNTWQVLNTEVDLDQGLWRWTSPDTVTIALARMRFDDQFFETDPFVIGPITQPSVGFDCGDSSLLQWPKAEAATSYQLFELMGNALEPFAEVSDTLFVINDQEINSGIYAVRPILGDGKPALRSGAFELDRLSIGCYFNSFFSEVLPDEGVGLILQLGSTYEVDQVVFERLEEDQFQQLAQQDEVLNFTNVVDTTPGQGLNRYRAGIVFKDGRTLYTDTIATYFLTEKKVLAFPNPIHQGEDLNVFTRVFQDGDSPVFELMDAQGKVHIKWSIVLESESIPLGELPPGLYFYRVSGLGSDVGGRIVVR
ncbi:MAG: S8 family peptidase [Cytophagales bacterium]|nr:S8 family peptidase [Cytophagales bacterium]